MRSTRWLAAEQAQLRRLQLLLRPRGLRLVRLDVAAVLLGVPLHMRLQQDDRHHCGYPNSNSATLSSASCRRSEEHTSELQSLMRISYAVFCLKQKNIITESHKHRQP